MEQYKKEKEEIEGIITDLIEDNNNLKDIVADLEDTIERNKAEYQARVDELENELSEVNKYYEQPKARLSFKKKADFIRLENDIRQKNIYIDSLHDKIKEMQNSEKNFLNNSSSQHKLHPEGGVSFNKEPKKSFLK